MHYNNFPFRVNIIAFYNNNKGSNQLKLHYMQRRSFSSDVAASFAFETYKQLPSLLAQKV